VCFSRQRYGTPTCPAERLRADLLEQVVIDALLDTFQQATTCSSRPSPPPIPSRALRDQHQAELVTVTGRIGKAEAAIERNLDALEAGTLPEDICGQQVQDLSGWIAKLRFRQDELRQSLDAATSLQPPQPPSAG
jgi:site-specific DNA recombinase